MLKMYCSFMLTNVTNETLLQSVTTFSKKNIFWGLFSTAVSIYALIEFLFPVCACVCIRLSLP